MDQTRSMNVLLLGVMLVRGLTSVLSDVLEACSDSKLEAECHPGYALLLKQARYGRLHLGRCQKTNYGHVGCSADVRDHIDPLCSGRQSCSFEVFNTLQEMKPKSCSELEAFLEIEYDCIPVIPLSWQQCDEGVVTIQDTEGYIPSFHWAAPVGGGSSSVGVTSERSTCHVKLVAKRGQLWNLTLLDFGRPDPEQLSLSSGGHGELVEGQTWCRRYGQIIETVDGQDKETVICGPSARERNIYLSNSNELTIEVFLNRELSSYLIAFKATGCAIPENPNIVRIGQNGANQTFRCNTTNEKWTLQCSGSRWLGEHKPCGTDPTFSELGTLSKDWNSATGLVIVIGLGLLLGVVIGTTLLSLVICYYKRRYRRPPPPVQQFYTGTTYGDDPSKGLTPAAPLYKTYGKSPERLPTGTGAASLEYVGRRQQQPASASLVTGGGEHLYKYPYQSCQTAPPVTTGQQLLPHGAASCHGDHHVPLFGVHGRQHVISLSTEDDAALTSTPPHCNVSPIPYKTASDSSSSSDHVYEIPS